MSTHAEEFYQNENETIAGAISDLAMPENYFLNACHQHFRYFHSVHKKAVCT
jgi:hypothetical protein